MRMLVIGMGSLGSVYAAKLKEVADVRCQVRTIAQAQSLESLGYCLKENGATRQVALRCYPRSVNDGWRAQIGLMLTKSADASNAAWQASHQLEPEAPVVTLQNGLGNLEALGRALGPERAVAGVSYVAAMATAPACVEIVSMGVTIVGAEAANKHRLEGLVDMLNTVRMPAELSSDVQTAIWKKVVLASSLNSVAALVDAPLAEVWSDFMARSLLETLVTEAAAVANAEGVALDVMKLLADAQELCILAAAIVPSMAQDLRSGRPTEIDSLSGEIVRRGAVRAVPTPGHSAVWFAIRSLARRPPAAG